MPRAPEVSPDGKFYWNGSGWSRMPSDPSPSIFGWALQRVTKALVPNNGNGPGPAVEQSMVQQGMDPSRPFSPGRPLNPYFGFSVEPRQSDFPTGVNITARPRHNLVSFETLRQMTANYDVARMCIARRIDSFRSFDWSIVPADGDSTVVKEEIALARRAIARPDGRTPYSSWISMYLEDLFRFDAGTLYRRRNRGGKVIGLEVVDGSSIAPLLDEFGRPPMAPAPAFIQYANGVPWDWLTDEDLIYLPYRPQPESPYGLAPMETVLLTANTDLRLQKHLLEDWTEGSIPGAIAEAPEDMSSPAEVEELQDAWDAKVESDQTKKVQVRWVPHGSNFKPLKEGGFDEPLALWLLRKTCAAYSVVPQDLGLTMDVNRASGDTQVDIQERIADRPLALHIDGILTAYLQDDLGLPVKMQTSLAAEKEDRKTEAEAWKIYIETGMASADEGRQKILGLEIDSDRPVPRFILNPRTGPIPLESLFAIAGPIDPETAAPDEDVPLVDEQYNGAGAVLPDKLPGGTQFKRAPINPDDPNHPANQTLRPETGVITPPAQATAPAPPSAAAVAPPATAVRKDANKALVAAGLVVRAADTGRVLMLQRALDDTDPAAGTWEWPCGHIEGDESAWEAACREWQEETGCSLPDGKAAGTWTVGVYQGFVWEIPSESEIQLNAQQGRVLNPDDPDQDSIEIVAWFDASHVRAMPALRPECLLTDWDLVTNWAPTRKAETAGVTSDTGMVGYDLADGDEDPGPDYLTFGNRVVGRADFQRAADAVNGDYEDSAEVQKELNRWRANARGRVKDGRRPRPFTTAIVSPAHLASIWATLQGASTREEVDAAFVRKASTHAFSSHDISAAVLAELAPELHELRQVTRQLEDAKRELHERDMLAAVTKAALPAPIQVDVHVPEQKAPDVHVHNEAQPVQKAEAPVINVDVHVPEQKAPVVKVDVAAPNVQVHNEIKPSKKARVRRHPDGSTTIERED